MGSKDKRIKGCPDHGCARHIEHYRYKPADRFCTLCGSQLVYVCAKCFEEIEDTEDQRRYCENCRPKQSRDGKEAQKPPKEKKQKEAKEQKPPKEKKQKEKRQKEKKEPGKGKEAVTRGVAVIKGKAPEIRDKAIKIAKDP